ncbi:hypothetical protein B0T10DRAFT_556770 [Thelonectria olida]|uniref:Uncharacterized protein n=1 Tax=Thelonectria olida TaxID=1576542 RepID=A0A9P9AV92_9HYPO|nr:hypothetical protein B0T10DRAFT_556770 [Thelonectria olida]
MPRTRTNHDVNATLDAVKVPKKRGPKPKSLSERACQVRKPVQRVERTYSVRRKQEVIMWMLHHKINDPTGYWAVNGWRKPYLREAGEYFKIPINTIATWLRNKKKICGDDVGEESPPGPPQRTPGAEPNPPKHLKQRPNRYRKDHLKHINHFNHHSKALPQELPRGLPQVRP